jgi:hypothetical protein
MWYQELLNDPLLQILWFILALAFGWFVIRIIFKVAMRIFFIGCLAIFIIGLVMVLFSFIPV